jgi:hypothetical protein
MLNIVRSRRLIVLTLSNRSLFHKTLECVTIDDDVCEEVDILRTNIKKDENIQIDLNDIEWCDCLQICLKIVWCTIIIHARMKIINQKMIERSINKINDHYFSILNEIRWDNECFSIREIIRVWKLRQDW